jgi:NDP-sugar pyrophosphorylase family protein
LKGKLAIFTSNQWSDFSKELLDFLLREIKSLRPNVELIPVTDSSWEDFGYSQDLHVMNALMEAKKKGFDFALLIWIKQVKGKTQDKLESISVEIRLLEIKRRIDCIAAIVTINNRENLSRRVILHRIAKIIASRLI